MSVIYTNKSTFYDDSPIYVPSHRDFTNFTSYTIVQLKHLTDVTYTFIESELFYVIISYVIYLYI